MAPTREARHPNRTHRWTPLHPQGHRAPKWTASETLELDQNFTKSRGFCPRIIFFKKRKRSIKKRFWKFGGESYDLIQDIGIGFERKPTLVARRRRHFFLQLRIANSGELVKENFYIRYWQPSFKKLQVGTNFRCRKVRSLRVYLTTESNGNRKKLRNNFDNRSRRREKKGFRKWC